eukprot:CAMPEP_0179102504 /NCGR_PEP_ID=MMETSP0796-20121207/47447_1 /TAXON_ID=73915 /ORGANISM="Pyrodinium bahamense, Strain pbaha01" /LENGTH=66 /DNA_ID=CAMNT_0020800383 /DNA_START=42 /DNA_END=242 /DNA_ORIENTATION=-
MACLTGLTRLPGIAPSVPPGVWRTAPACPTLTALKQGEKDRGSALVRPQGRVMTCMQQLQIPDGAS